jgi:catechol 2,3-dioxygenase-like lactoylglutathione lyase family enzyme
MKSDKTRKTPAKRDGSTPRRDFIKQVGVVASAAIGVMSAPTGAAALAQTAARPKATPGPLTDSPVVMVWRRVSALQRTKAFTDKVLRLPVVGEDPVSIMYDGGSTLVGYAISDVPASNDPVYAACSEIGLEEFYLQNNPASTLQFVPSDFSDAVRNLHEDRKLATPPESAASGELLRFVDDDGNFNTFYKPSAAALRGDAGNKLASILRWNWAQRSGIRNAAIGPEIRPPQVHSPVVGIDLLVSDLQRSRRFYGETLGLTPLEVSDSEVKFDLGRVILTLRREPTNMLVQLLRKSGRLLGDWVVFHVDDIKATTAALKTRAVEFPAGIESSLIGDIAYFNDPDGYSLNIWKPSGRTKMIDFNPALQRILKDSSTTRATA